MTKQLPYLLPLLLPGAILSAQTDDYWQQEVHYRIDVVLDDQRHQLNGEIELNYINHSPDALDTVYLHLWANAFSDRTTAFADQQLRQGEQDFYFADPEDLGYYSDLDFKVNGQAVHWRLTAEHPDIAYLLLPAPLASGDSLRIHTPFNLKIPASFSRLGHVGESYQMTQWYPKPAVYDRRGWHPMPYLDMGEFYSEFGNYDVTITLPANYVVGATGTLQTESERQWLRRQADRTSERLNRGVSPSFSYNQPFPPSSTELKTIRFTAERVHDFAWFADKRFQVQRSLVVLPSGKEVDTWVFFTQFEEHLWQDAIHYVDRAVRFYSETVGAYPYPQATAVQSALSAGSGMEYPMITVIGPAGRADALDEVITHEVGHNWFYGILASDERRHPWMDEGINSYYEQRYMRRYYGATFYEDNLPDLLRGQSEMSLSELAYLYQARRHRDQAPETPSDRFTELNYLIGAYQKPADAFRYLEAYLGTDTFDRLMQDFYVKWQFRHPYPRDLQQHLEAGSEKDLSWLFEGLLGSNKKMDYALTGLKKIPEGYRVAVENRGGITAPISLSGKTDDGKVTTRWYEGFKEDSTLIFPASDCRLIELDANRLAPELYRQNNRIRTDAFLPKTDPLLISLFPSLENDERTQLFFSPFPAWNNYDKFMLGGLVYNSTVPAKRLEFQLAPMYAFGTNQLTGLGRIEYHLFPNIPVVQELTLGIGVRSFNFLENTDLDYRLRYARLMPYLQLDLGAAPASPFSHHLKWRTLWINREEATFTDGQFSGKTWDDRLIHELSYYGKNDRAVNPFSFHIALEQQRYRDIGGRQHYLRASLEWQQHFTYKENKNIDLRVFAGSFLINTRRDGGRLFPGAFNLIAQGFNDYRFDELYLGRSENEGFWSQQISLREGAFKTPLGGAFPLGRSNNYILAMNLTADLPQDFFLPLKPYLDLGYFDNAQPTGQEDTFQGQFLWSAGLAVEIGGGLFGIYFPLLNSQNLEDRLTERGNFWTRVSFNFDFARLNPFEAVNRVEF